MLTDSMRKVIYWAAQECEWQMSGEKSVAWMMDGWDYAMALRHNIPVVDDIIHLGRLVEPRKNRQGWRTVNVQVGYDVKMHYESVPAAIVQHAESIYHITNAPEMMSRKDAVEWFRVYEEIHPFRDGNGRTGNILYNWLSGTLHDPQMPPNLWNDPRRGDVYE